MHEVLRVLFHVLGIDNPGGRWYLFWSGAGADVVLVGGVLGVVRNHTCDVRHCWRIGRYPIAGTGFSVCRRHHPDPESTRYQPVLVRPGEATESLGEVGDAKERPG